MKNIVVATIAVSVALLSFQFLSLPHAEAQTPALRPTQGGTGTTTAPRDLQLLVGLNSGVYGVRTLTAGSGIALSTSTTALTISATGGGAGGGGSNWLFNGSRLSPSTTVGIAVFASSTVGDGSGAGGLTVNGGATTTGAALFTSAVQVLNSTLTLNGGNLSAWGGTWNTGGIDIASGDDYEINGTDVLTATGLGSGVLSSSLTSVGTLTALTVSGATSLSTLTATAGTTTSATSTNLSVASSFKLGSDLITDITGSGLAVSSSALTCNTASASVFGCLSSADWTAFNQKVSSSSIDTVGELETLTGVNLIVSTEIDTIAEIEALAAGVNIITSGEIDTLSEIETIAAGTNIIEVGEIDSCPELAAIITGETGSCGSIVLSGAPTFTGLSLFASASGTNLIFQNATTTNATTTTQHVSGLLDTASSTVSSLAYVKFTWPSTPTTTTATTTVPLASAPAPENWLHADCRATAGSISFVFTDTGTNDMNGWTATSTVGRRALTTNNSFIAEEQQAVEIGPITNGQLTCTATVHRNP